MTILTVDCTDEMMNFETLEQDVATFAAALLATKTLTASLYSALLGEITMGLGG